ncbi:FHA domain-containing protein [Corallococcus macrosporus]|uniref:FHA domain-TPR-repeat-containing protein n=1 Tax=Myxococcus fulvus (strain ATCC BAA-855 / HW-1) TaxID=483219 RepID=F8CKN2_MYXFH|nr:FHA domain-containing protein [Corallococcus macrosporus]AEI68965.1 FHA domain- TPR-repeat-containing protein [Corallococcus macrosporus]
MLKLIIEDDEGRKTVVPFVRDEITIGRQEGNTIRLTERNVSRRHARLVRLNGHVVVEDLGSYNGTRINGERIAGQSPLKEGDLVQIGDYDLALQAEGAANAAAGPITTKVPARRPEPEPEDDSDEDADDERDHTPPSQSAADARRHSTSIIRLDQVEAERPRKVVDVPAEDAPRLLVLSPDELKGQEFACIRTELRIGRTDDNDITLDHRSLSRTHAKLVREDSGEWRVIDMQSANGMTINGENYAQATLSTGDIVELGHVKLRFVNAGDAADDVADGGGSRSKLGLVAGLAALLLGGGGAAAYYMNQQGTQPAAPPVVAQVPTPVPDDAPPAAVGAQAPANTPQVAATPPPQVPETPPPPKGPSMEEQRAVADKAIAARDFDAAVEALEGIQDANGKRPRDVETRLDEARAEQLMKRRLDDVRKALGDGKLPEAEEALRESAATKAFAREYAALKVQVAEAQKKAAPPAAVPTSGTEKAPPPTQSAAAKAQAEGFEHIKGLRYRQAIEQLNKCLDLEPNRAECHLYLGSAYANDNQPEKGAVHYKRFLELAPNHAYYERVKGLVESYENPKK